MAAKRAVLVAVALTGGCLVARSAVSASATALQRIDRGQICVTNGFVSTLPDGRMAIDTPSSRGVLRVPTAPAAEIRFRYLGPSASSKPLASGELRRQLGLKLLAQDTCNLLYVMWHIEPDTKLAVLVKRNPGQHTHQECDARGYVTIKARDSVALPRIVPGELHSLRAELHGGELSVVADGKLVWTGSVGNRIAGLEGPVGFRTDNGRFALEYYADVAGGTPGAKSAGPGHLNCESSPGD